LKLTLHIFFFSILIGILAGLASALFLISLDWVTATRTANNWLIYFLPAGACFNVVLYGYFISNQDIQKGTKTIIEASRAQKVAPSWLMAPLVLLATLASHLFGGCVGREGTAIQMSGGVMAGMQKIFKNFEVEQSTTMKMAIAAGFASVFGVPWAGFVFAFEVSKTKKFNWQEVLSVLLASWLGFVVCNLFPIAHTHYTFQSVSYELITFAWVALAVFAFGLAARLYVFCAGKSSFYFKKIVNPYLRIAFGGFLVMLAFIVFKTDDFHGIGVAFIEKSFVEQIVFYGFLLKIALTTISLGSGMKGGEVTPLFFIGAALGSTLAGFIPLPIGFLAGLGFIGVFAGASKTPIACAIMGLEIFEPRAGLFFLAVCFLTNLIAGKKGIYD
jgi:H+/Cl- antiporter ClcA